MSLSSFADSNDGVFKRKESSFRRFISRQPGAEFPPEKGRYHLYISYACPWASRCYAFMKLKGLDDVIGLTVSLSLSLSEFVLPRSDQRRPLVLELFLSHMFLLHLSNQRRALLELSLSHTQVYHSISLLHLSDQRISSFTSNGFQKVTFQGLSY
jgi:hypothetical protein